MHTAVVFLPTIGMSCQQHRLQDAQKKPAQPQRGSLLPSQSAPARGYPGETIEANPALDRKANSAELQG